jgi:hypothetical protein
VLCYSKLTLLEFDVINDFIVTQVKLDGVVDIDVRVGISEGSSVVSDDVRDLVGGNFLSFDLAQFILQRVEGVCY